MKNTREIISDDPETHQGKDQKNNSRQTVILLSNSMGHIVNDHHEQQNTGEDHQ